MWGSVRTKRTVWGGVRDVQRPAPSRTAVETQRVSLLHLPNELLLQILEHLCRDFADDDNGRATAGPPLDLLLVCRRLYHLTTSLRLRKIRLEGETSDIDSILAYLLVTPEAFEAVQDIEVHVGSVCEVVKVLTALFPRFECLRVLRIVDDLEPDEDGESEIFSHIDAFLAASPALRYLELHPTHLYAEDDFAVCSKPIERVAMNAANFSSEAVAFLQAANLTRLRLCISLSDKSLIQLPWDTLDTLELDFDSELTSVPTQFFLQLSEDIGVYGRERISLKRLTVIMRVTLIGLSGPLSRLKLAFAGCTVQELVVKGVNRGFDIAALDWAWPTLRTLEIAMPHAGILRRQKSFKHTMKALAIALPKMPDLTQLTLVNVNLSECDCCRKPTVDSLLAPDVDLALDFPALHVFLQKLVASSVLDFRIRTTASAASSGLGVEARYQRMMRTIEFRVERWTVE